MHLYNGQLTFYSVQHAASSHGGRLTYLMQLFVSFFLRSMQSIVFSLVLFPTLQQRMFAKAIPLASMWK